MKTCPRLTAWACHPTERQFVALGATPKVCNHTPLRGDALSLRRGARTAMHKLGLECRKYLRGFCWRRSASTDTTEG
ncbi:MAG: hypothetical protein MI923_06165 [Phycisphaerales bacterium]|nr:hypothetical protein [Phycisphaerales bacterium]